LVPSPQESPTSCLLLDVGAVATDHLLPFQRSVRVISPANRSRSVSTPQAVLWQSRI